MIETEFKEADPEGLETLDVISSANKFNKWMYTTIKPFCKGDILEIGSGTGNISNYFLKDGLNLTLSDIRKSYCQILERKFVDSAPSVIEMNIIEPDFDQKFSHLFEKFDTIFALNIIEHLDNDYTAINNIEKLLKKNGSIIILVPAYMILYNEFDKGLGHFRRYTRKTLNKLVASKFTVVCSQYFNTMGILGWFFTGSILKKKVIPGNQMGLYNKLVPVFKIIDKLFANRIGLSVISVGKKTGSN